MPVKNILPTKMTPTSTLIDKLKRNDPRALARAITLVENGDPQSKEIMASLDRQSIRDSLVLGITGPPGAGKSTLTGQLIGLLRQQGQRVGIIAIDPSSPISGGAILGDRVRMMDHALDPDVIVRSMATRGRLGGLCASAGAAVRIMASCGCRYILIETVGVGQSEMDIVSLADITLMVLAPGFGDDIQAMKAGLLEVADMIAVNKSDLPGAAGLHLDMEQLFHQRNMDEKKHVVKISASLNQHIDSLLKAINNLAAEYNLQGEKDRRRESALKREALDWALETMRPEIASIIEQLQADNSSDPRISAETAITRFIHRKERT